MCAGNGEIGIICSYLCECRPVTPGDEPGGIYYTHKGILISRVNEWRSSEGLVISLSGYKVKASVKCFSTSGNGEFRELQY